MLFGTINSWWWFRCVEHGRRWCPGGGQTRGNAKHEKSRSVLGIACLKKNIFFALQGVAPMLIKQINDGEEKGMVLFGMNFNIVTIVAIVRNIDHSSTKISYTLEDHTGQIDAHLWLEEGDSMKSPNVLLNTYARVFGSIRSQGGGKSIMIFKIEALDSINELTTHLLEVLMTRYKAEDISENGGRVISGGSGAAMDIANNTGHSNGNNGDPQAGLNQKDRMVFNAVKECNDEQGISLQALQRKFSHLPAEEI